MQIKYSIRFKKQVVEVYPGEYYTTSKNDIVLSTILGSCVAVCLYDEVHQVVGINHIMISNKTQYKMDAVSVDTRYGIHAMEVLINEMIKKGASRSYMKAKVFGGGKVLIKNNPKIAFNNIDFAVEYLKNEAISIISQDTGGNYGRKIFFFTDNYRVYLKRLEMSKTLKRNYEKEILAIKNERKKAQNNSNLTLFDE